MKIIFEKYGIEGLSTCLVEFAYYICGGILMTSSELIVDDDYIKRMGRYYYVMGNTVVDKMIDEYIKKLEEIKNVAIMEGDIADSLNIYIENAQSLKNKAGEIGSELKSLMTYFLTDVDKADQFLF